MKICRKGQLSLKVNLPVIMTIGNFDGVHLGHLALLQHMQNKASVGKMASLVVTFANHPAEFFKPYAPFYRVTTEEQKCRLIKNCGIEYLQVMEFNAQLANQTAEQFFLSFLSQFRLAHVILGHDAVLGSGRQGNQQEIYRLADKYHFNVSYLPPVLAEGLPISSSTIRTAIASGNFKATERQLGRKYSLAIRASGQKSFTVRNIVQSLPPSGEYVALFNSSRNTSIPALVEVDSANRQATIHLERLFSGDGEILF